MSYDPISPCALKCQARGKSLVVELAPKVLDGTRCKADSLDMCINGICQVSNSIFIYLCGSKINKMWVSRKFLKISTWILLYQKHKQINKRGPKRLVSVCIRMGGKCDHCLTTAWLEYFRKC